MEQGLTVRLSIDHPLVVEPVEGWTLKPLMVRLAHHERLNLKLSRLKWVAKICQQWRQVKELEGWIRRHMRKYFWQCWHNRRGRLNALKRLKAKPYHLKQASGSVGVWRLA